MSLKIFSKTPEENKTMLNNYSVGRGVVYIVEICLMIWVVPT